MAKRAGEGGFVRLPPHRPGLRIGIYGGSFDPPHPGHRHVALTALVRLRLDRVWWLVSPGNPLKDRRRLPGAPDRLRLVRDLARHPRMAATDFETRIGSRFTVETIRFLLRRCPGVRFVLLIGADSLASFHRWRAWREIASLVPIAVVDRPLWTLGATASPAAGRLARRRLAEPAARHLAGERPPAWVFLHGPRSGLSSTALRDRSRKEPTDR